MGRLGTYKIDLKGQEQAEASYNWLVDSDFFAALDVEDIQNGHVTVNLTVTKTKSREFELAFVLNGDVDVPCDRCLEDMPVDINTEGVLAVRLGDDFADDGDVIIIPEADGSINVSWYIYEFISLAIPLKHVHAPGKCNKEMTEQLEKHASPDFDTDNGERPANIDWSGLENLKFEE